MNLITQLNHQSQMRAVFTMMTVTEDLLGSNPSHLSLVLREIIKNIMMQCMRKASNFNFFVATSNKDTMYWHQAIKKPDSEEFRNAAVK